MKRITTREEIEHKEKRNKLIVGLILVAIMVIGPAGYAFFSNEKANTGTERVKYNGIDFYRQGGYGGYWQAQIQGYNLYFHYLPNETRSLMLGKSIGDYTGKTVYFEKMESGEQEIGTNFNQMKIKWQLACLDENCTENLPLKNCSSNLILVRHQENMPAIRTEDNCIYILSNDSVREADAFLYSLLKIQ